MEDFKKIIKGFLYVAMCAPMIIGLIIAATGNGGSKSTSSYSSAPYMRNYNEQKRQYELNKQKSTKYYQYQNSQIVTISTGNLPRQENTFIDDEGDNYGSFTPDDAYEEGRERGYEQGLEDGNCGKRFEWGYDASNSYYNHYETMYEDGYSSGYEDGYNEGRDDYEQKHGDEYEE